MTSLVSVRFCSVSIFRISLSYSPSVQHSLAQAHARRHRPPLKGVSGDRGRSAQPPGHDYAHPQRGANRSAAVHGAHAALPVHGALPIEAQPQEPLVRQADTRHPKKYDENILKFGLHDFKVSRD